MQKDEWIGLAVLLCIGLMLYYTIPQVPLFQEWLLSPTFTQHDLEISIIMVTLIIAGIIVFLKMTR